MVKVSAYIPSYNNCDTIESAINYIKEQTLKFHALYFLG